MASEAVPEAPPTESVWMQSQNQTFKYTLQDTWQWVIDDVEHEGMKRIENASDLPSSILRAAQAMEPTPAGMTPGTARRRRQRSRRDRGQHPSFFNLESVQVDSDELTFAFHGTSAAFDGLDDKDELARTLQRCRCDHLNLSPQTTLINWDVTHEECLNVVGETLPVIEGNKDKAVVAVLKEPTSSQGQGIFFVRDSEEIHKVIDENRQRAMQEPGYLDSLIEAKGRIPSWVLQAEVNPSLLIRGGRKFHIRSYLVVLEKTHHTDLLDIFLFNRHEVRVAGVPVEEMEGTERDLKQYITNGAVSESSERLLLDQVEEISGLQSKLELFISDLFGKHLMSDISRRVYSGQGNSNDVTGLPIRKFAVGGLDLMVTEEGRIYLLEVNVNPSAPKESTVDAAFRSHLKEFLKSFVDLVAGSSPPNFLNTRDILRENGVLEE